MVLVRFIDELVCLDVTVKVVRDEVIVSMVDNAINEGRKLSSITKHAITNGVEYCSKIRIELELRVEVGVSEILDVFSEVAEEEDILFTDFTGDLDLNDISMSEGVKKLPKDDLHLLHRKYR